jgi:hypothetical protein
MSGVLVNAANRVNASRAGLTSIHQVAPTTQGTSATEVASHAFSSVNGELDALLFSEGVPAPVGTPIEKPTGSVAGRLGGLIPTGILSGVQPGPARAAPATGPKPLGAVARLRKTLGL